MHLDGKLKAAGSWQLAADSCSATACKTHQGTYNERRGGIVGGIMGGRGWYVAVTEQQLEAMAGAGDGSTMRGGARFESESVEMMVQR